MFEAARCSEYPQIFETEILARQYIADTPIEGARPWIRQLRMSISGNFIVVGGKDLVPAKANRG